MQSDIIAKASGVVKKQFCIMMFLIVSILFGAPEKLNYQVLQKLTIALTME